MDRATKTFGFGRVALQKFPESRSMFVGQESSRNLFLKRRSLIPLAVIIGGACAMCGSFMAYSISTKPDVQLIRSSGSPVYEEIKPEEKRKLITLNQKYAPIPELEELRKEIGSYKY